jgi:hypothetical protein
MHVTDRDAAIDRCGIQLVAHAVILDPPPRKAIRFSPVERFFFRWYAGCIGGTRFL